MIIVFASRKLQKIINDSRNRQKTFGERAKPLGQRLDDLQAVSDFQKAFLLPGRLEPLEGGENEFSMHLTANWRLILAPANEPLPRKEDSGIDYSQVDIVKIIRIEDYHKG
ncbi:MAG: killer suppression protein HigA [Candidatus Sumerlaeota bacterium]|nr:killer suppression protein HigA [Candidatus Sumerlaeota bacterium]